MNHLDAAITDIVVILHGHTAGQTPDTVKRLKKAGMHIDHVDRDNGVVEGSVDAYKVRDLEKIEGVDYIRKVFTYYADYPREDPRDQDVYEEI